MQYNDLAGWIEVICGPMYAGKTEELIRRITRMDYAKKNYLVFKPQIDDRYAVDSISSHTKRQKEAINIKDSSEIEKYVKEDTQAIVIDEIQFFDSNMLNVVTKYANLGLRVICAGLDLDFKGEPFGIIPNLLAIAEKITKLTAICVCCGNEATLTQRIINGKEASYLDPIVLVGAKESYEARCRKCHKVIKNG